MRLAISFAGVQISYFSDLQIKSYGCLKFLEEIWTGRACVGANEEVTHGTTKYCRLMRICTKMISDTPCQVLTAHTYKSKRTYLKGTTWQSAIAQVESYHWIIK
jgi:hypothetical protein